MQSLQIASSGPQEKLTQGKANLADHRWPSFRAMGLSGYSPVSLGRRLQEPCHQLSPNKVKLTAAQQQMLANVPVKDIMFVLFAAQHKNGSLARLGSSRITAQRMSR